jgi:hypothetical protein
MTNTTATEHFYIYPASTNAAFVTTSITSGALQKVSPPPAYAQPAKDIEGAVYGYITAIRALGRTTINTKEISHALNLPLAAVDKAAKRLTAKGVKVAA